MRQMRCLTIFHSCLIIPLLHHLLMISSGAVGRTGCWLHFYHHEVPMSEYIDLSKIKSLPPDPLGPLPAEFQDDPLLVNVDFVRSCRYGLVWNPKQFCFLYSNYGKLSMEDALREPTKAGEVPTDIDIDSIVKDCNLAGELFPDRRKPPVKPCTEEDNQTMVTSDSVPVDVCTDQCLVPAGTELPAELQQVDLITEVSQDKT